MLLEKNLLGRGAASSLLARLPEGAETAEAAKGFCWRSRRESWRSRPEAVAL